MSSSGTRTKNITGLELIWLAARLAKHSFGTMLDSRNRRIRRESGLNLGDAVFNHFKLFLLKYFLLKYRSPVSFGDVVLLDSTMPPYPSPAFDKRISNYMNTLDTSFRNRFHFHDELLPILV